ncbi:hypothetical protein [Zhihengliuella halotolerans]|uniref:hypothetical protein n=1 Tax=Zhihengliuella halotolerans TaxID=370736 RepID=UPI000C80A292|nr:hypothetical protein [Zhihengliuella halotolerans]
MTTPLIQPVARHVQYVEDGADILRRAKSNFANHVMIVEHDDGVHRHLVFRQPGTSFYGFEIITWPGGLTITGDMSTMVFRRLNDMIEFFDPDYVNVQYWLEKERTRPGYDRKQYDVDAFKRWAIADFWERSRDLRHDQTRLWWAELRDVLEGYEIGSWESAYRTLDHLEHGDYHDLHEDVPAWAVYDFADMLTLLALLLGCETYRQHKKETP